MKRINVLPADTYTVANKTVITEKDKKIISLLYQPIIGHTATALYFTLIDDLDKSEYLRQEVETIKSTFGYNSDKELVDAQLDLIFKLKREII